MRRNTSSGLIAKDRLEQMLLSEKMQSSPEMTSQMKREIGAVLRKYLNIGGQMRMEVQIQLINDSKQGAEYVKTIQIKGL